MRWSSLSFQLVGAMLLLTLGLGLIRTYLNRAEVEQFAREQFEQRSIATASAFAAYATDAVLTNDLFQLNELINDTLLNNSDARYILVLDAQSRVLAQSFGRGIPKGLLDANRVRADVHFHLQRIATEEGFILDVAAPLFDGKLGAVRVGMSERALNADIDRHTINLLAQTALSLIPVFITAYLLARVLARPLEKLVEATGAVARGDFTHHAPIVGQDEIAQLGNAFNAMTRALAQSQGALQTSNEQLRALNTLAGAISHSANLDALLNSALNETLQVMNLATGWIALHDAPRDVRRVIAARNIEPTRAAEIIACDCARAVGDGARLMHDGAKCAMLDAHHALVPLASHERVWGALHLVCAQPDCFADERLRLLTALGQQIGLAIENLELAEAQRRETFRRQLLDRVIDAQEEERKRIARELHDEFAQSLTALIVGLQTHEQTLARDDATRARLVDTRTLAAQILEQTRRLIFDLRPTVLDDAGLAPALRSFGERACAPARIAFDFQIDGARRRLAPHSETALFRIAQEAMNNVVKHARAQHIALVLQFESARVSATIEDDGVGFDVANAWRANGVGLMGMRERAELLGGQLEIVSQVGNGTRVRVEIPA